MPFIHNDYTSWSCKSTSPISTLDIQNLTWCWFERGITGLDTKRKCCSFCVQFMTVEHYIRYVTVTRVRDVLRTLSRRPSHTFKTSFTHFQDVLCTLSRRPSHAFDNLQVVFLPSESSSASLALSVLSEDSGLIASSRSSSRPNSALNNCSLCGGNLPERSKVIRWPLERRCFAKWPGIRNAMAHSLHLNGRGSGSVPTVAISTASTLAKCCSVLSCFDSRNFVGKCKQQSKQV